MSDNKYLRSVRDQYESLPYPPRNPEDERNRLKTTVLDDLRKINHYGFNGQLQCDGFRVLVAGDGTGDSSIYLAEQLRDFDAEVVVVDISEASMTVARQRAKERDLNNISWKHASLLALPELDLAPFDYICCGGVLHHLEDPEAGLHALCAVLKPDGLLGLMLYASVGRTGVYHMQHIMRLINADRPVIAQKIQRTKSVLESLPAGNWLKKSEGMFPDAESYGDPGIYDLFLHSQDRAYSIAEVFDFLASSELQLINFALPQDRVRYRPSTFIRDDALNERIRRLPIVDQLTIGELLAGDITKHSFYAAKSSRIAAPTDLDMVPFWMDSAFSRLYVDIEKLGGQPMRLDLASGLALTFQPRKYTAQLFRWIDGKSSLSEMFDKLRAENAVSESDDILMQDFRAVYPIFADMDLMLLRHKDAPALMEPRQLQLRAFTR